MSPRGNLNRTVVVQKAIELSNKNGWEHLNLHQLARELGIRTPSLYNHIGGLPELRKFISWKATAALIEKIKDATIGKSGADACLAMAWAYLEFARANPGLISAIAAAPDKENKEAMETDKNFIQMGMAIMSGFNLGQTESIHALRAIRCATHGFAVLENEQGFGIDIDPNVSFEWMIQSLVESFRKWDSGDQYH